MPVKTNPLSMSQRLEKIRLKSLTSYERRIRALGYEIVCGLDEAGRGPLAGPVVAAACVIPEGIYFEGIDDSKKLTAEKREAIFQKIRENPEIDWGVGIVDAYIIDQVNILRATLQAMMVAVAQLKKQPGYLLVDGKQVPDLAIASEAIVDGDNLVQSIMAAAIVAKCTRDNLMAGYDEKWPEYGFKQHKGYGTKMHLQALQKHGLCPIHRRSFEPVKSMAAL